MNPCTGQNCSLSQDISCPVRWQSVLALRLRALVLWFEGSWSWKTWFAKKKFLSTMMTINLPIYDLLFKILQSWPSNRCEIFPGDIQPRLIDIQWYLRQDILQTTRSIGLPIDAPIFLHVENFQSMSVAAYTDHIAYSLIQFRYCVQYARNALKEHFLVNFWGRHIQKTKLKKILAEVKTRFSRSGTQIITDREP